MAGFAQRLDHALMEVPVKSVLSYATANWQENSHREHREAVGNAEPVDMVKDCSLSLCCALVEGASGYPSVSAART
jgi:hypothetical protein